MVTYSEINYTLALVCKTLCNHLNHTILRRCKSVRKILPWTLNVICFAQNVYIQCDVKFA